MIISYTNLVASIVPTTDSAETPLYPVTSLQLPGRPLVLWKTLNTSEHWAKFNLGGVTAGRILAYLANGNFATVHLEGNNSDLWVTPPFTQAISLVQNPITGRYGMGVDLAAFPYSWFRLRIPAQATLDGDDQFSLGGVWFGSSILVPRGLIANVTFEDIKPRRFIDSAFRNFEDYADLGPRRVGIQVSRRAKTNVGNPGVGDELATWQAIDRQWGGKAACVMLSRQTPDKTFVLRNVGELTWARDQVRVARSDARLVEVLGP